MSKNPYNPFGLRVGDKLLALKSDGEFTEGDIYTVLTVTRYMYSFVCGAGFTCTYNLSGDVIRDYFKIYHTTHVRYNFEAYLTSISTMTAHMRQALCKQQAYLSQHKVRTNGFKYY